MICALRRLREEEEGQALVLAAVFGLVLALCVLGTVNLGRAVYDRIQLQAAADSAAYSQAAVEARVMNFTAYTNRAMVVHYASIMAATSYLTYVHFLWAGMRPALQVVRQIPYAGAVANLILQICDLLVRFLDFAVSLLTPLLSAANTVLYGLQEGAWWSVYFGRLARRLPPEAHSGDSAAHPYQPVWPNLIPLANQAVFSSARGHLSMPQNASETAQILVNAKSDAVQEARLHMLEIANSARQPWVAYGDRMGAPSPSPFARHWRWKVGCAQTGSVARTELGGFAPGTGTASLARLQAQVWSGERWQAALDCSAFGVHFKRRVPLFSFVAMDQLFATITPFRNSYFDVYKPSGIAGAILLAILPPLQAALSSAERVASSTRPNPDARPFWLSPYVYLSPNASSRPGIGRSGLGNFAQPDVIIGLNKASRDYDSEQGAQTHFGRRFSFDGRGAGRGVVDFNLAAQPATSRLPTLPPGLNAFAAAQVYYHRPGEWKEMPNLFNPLWGARLMPVLESNAASALQLSRLPGLSGFLLH